MADNVTTNPGTGGADFATDDIGGVHWQRVKVTWGVDGVANDASASNPLPVTVDNQPTALTMQGDAADYWPGYGGTTDTGSRNATVDPSGALITRGAVTTDEGTFRVNFANSSLAVSLGTVTVSGDVVTGTGFISSTTRDVHLGDYFKLDADGESAWRQIESVDSDTQLTLSSAYVGGSSGAASRALMRPVTGSGGSISVGSGQCTIASGTTIAAQTYIVRNIDYAPLVFRTAFSISQRIANQTIFAGMSEPYTVLDRWYARFSFSGTTNTVVVCETARNPTTTPSGSEIQSTTVTLPNGVTTAVSNEYRIEMLTERVVFYINGVRVAEHSRVIPAQHDEMEAAVRVVNGGSAPASSTNIVCDYVTGKNHNKLEVGIFSDTEQMVVQQPDLVPFSYSVAGVIAINTVLLTVDCLRFRLLGVQCTSMGTTGVVTPEWSLDGTTWVAATIVTPAGATATTFNAAGMWNLPVFARYFRLRLSTATTAGTTTIQVVAYAQGAGVFPSQSIQGTVTANIGTGSLAAGTNAIGDVGIQYRANATGAASFVSVQSPATPAAATIKATAGRVIGWQLQNSSTGLRSVKVFAVAAPTLGTTAAVFAIDIPAGGRSEVNLPAGLAFGTAATYSVTSAKGLTDNTATGLALNDVSGSFFFA